MRAVGPHVAMFRRAHGAPLGFPPVDGAAVRCSAARTARRASSSLPVKSRPPASGDRVMGRISSAWHWSSVPSESAERGNSESSTWVVTSGTCWCSSANGDGEWLETPTCSTVPSRCN